MYPGEGMHMYDGEEPVLHHPHHHHLPKMDDDDDDDNDNDNDNNDHHHHHPHHNHNPNPYPSPSPHKHSHKNPTPPKRSPAPPLRPQQPLQPPTPLLPPTPLQPPTPLRPQPPIQLQAPPQQLTHTAVSAVSPPPTPRKPLPPPPPPMNLNDDDDDDYKYKAPHRQLGAALFIVLLLFGLTALILWLIYRPSKPHFTAISALIYTLNLTAATTTTQPYVSASMQFVIHTRNPNKRTTLSYDRLSATMYYRNTAITPAVGLPPLFHRKKSGVIIAPVIGGPPPAVPVPVGWEVVNGLAADEAYGVVGFSWVVVGRVRYRAGGFKSGHSRVYVRCDVVVRLTGGLTNGVYINPSGQVPLLASPPCFVDI